ncbi:ricin-type beta-trefoil lectin domain protein [Streptomyces sp. ISL-43]|uniref:ricin-type beta-trefoil lectin domain protein n=1 Tax=Streptomyces sp. ISL-43 TaxID=2819183 RepID=UPI001BE8B357|nr:ricin-type beta-trefoil lectin domain protein [Streptomyces sp. ISL-43]MBT2445659.1 ricin-type beta-trefoil lectin domain protein [Streptomyces sp. ISL-43]
MLPAIGAVVLSLAAGLVVAPPAFAGNEPAAQGWPAPTAKPAPSALEKAVDEALWQARAMGKPVAIDRLTTGNSQTFANPGGTLTTEAGPAPERVKQADGSWRGVDTALSVNADGTLSPRAVPSPLTISGGGTGPMATMTTADGKKLAVKAPFPLPKPTLDGNDALYKNVMPDVDLRLSATQLGGWSQVLIVRTAEAAANPALKTIRLDVDAPALSTSADAAGNIIFKDAQGTARFSSPTSFMWDSAATAPAAALAGKSASVDSAWSAAPATDRPAVSSADGPGEGANVKPLAVKADATAIELIPDTALLGQGTGPWYIDPGVNPSADSANQAWAQVQEAYSDTNEFNGTSDGQDTPAAGYCGYSTCTKKGRERAYFQVGINSTIHGTEVIDARLHATVVSSSSPSTATPMGLYHSPTGIGNPTTWNNQPCDRASRMGGCAKIGGASISGTGEIEYDVTTQMKSAAWNRWPTFTFGFAPDDEGNMHYRQRFSNTPHIVVTYDITPTVGNPRTSPTPGFAGTGAYSACRTPGTTNPSDNPGWLGANTNVHLTSATNSATGRQLQTTFKLWDDDAGTATWSQTGWNGSSGDAVVDVGKLIDGHQYGWTSVATDGTLVSAETSYCYFRVDGTPPSAAVTSVDFPASGTTGGHPKRVGEPGTFTLAGADNAPINGSTRSSGLACARWTTDPVKAASDWNCSDTDSRITKLTGGKATVNFTPQAWGTNYLYLQTQDNAGNMSQPVAYSFYVPSNPKSPAPIFGDINGDSKADVVLADAAGNIRQINGGGDPATSPVALARSSLSGNGWSGIQLTHRGNLGDKPVDDLFAHEPAKPNLYVFTNNGTGLVDGQAPTNVVKPTRCVGPDAKAITCSTHDFGADWSKVTQIAAFGSLTGDSVPGSPNSLPQTSLLFVENGRLWLALPGIKPNRLDDTAILLSANDTRWDGYDLITPGRAQGTNFPTLWARSKTDGTLHAFSIKGTPEAPVLTGFTDPSAGLFDGKIDRIRYSRVGSDGDLTGDNIPDLWAVDKDQQLVVFNGIGTAPNGTTIPYPTVTGIAPTFTLQGNLNTPTYQWKLTGLTGTTNTTPSAGGTNHPATTAGITWPTGTIEGRSTTYAAFQGAGSTITTSGPGIDTRQDFTLTTWAKRSATTPANQNSLVVSQDGTQNSSFMIYADHKTGQWHFALASAQGGAWPFDHTGVANQAARFTPDAWTRLTAVYNAGSGLMSLYVNGVLASTGHHPAASSPVPSGPIVFGRYKVAGQVSDVFNGGVSNFASYSYAATPTAPGAMGRISLTEAPGMCADNDYAGTQDGNKIQIATCNGTTAQSFEVKADGSLRIQGKCVSATNAGTVNTTPLELRTCNGPTPAQKFLPRADGSIYNPVSGRCVDLGNFDTTPGRQLWLFDCNPSSAQRWTVMTLGTAPLPLPSLDAAP